MTPTKRRSIFTSFAKTTARQSGHPGTFLLALGIVIGWGLLGPLYGFSDTWQLVINTGTTIVTFLMVFLIQNTQNRDAEAIQLKLDELIRSAKGAHNALLDLEELEERDLDQIRLNYLTLARKARADLQMGKEDTGTLEAENDPASERPSRR